MLFLFWFFGRATPITWRVEGSITKWTIHQRPPHYIQRLINSFFFSFPCDSPNQENSRPKMRGSIQKSSSCCARKDNTTHSTSFFKTRAQL
jgi:hypothetical protein